MSSDSTYNKVNGFEMNNNANKSSNKLEQRSGYFESSSSSSSNNSLMHFYNNNNNNNNLYAILNTKQRIQSNKDKVANRAHQLLIYNQAHLNNLVNLNSINDNSVGLHRLLKSSNQSSISNSGINSGRSSSQTNFQNLINNNYNTPPVSSVSAADHIHSASTHRNSSRLLVKMPFKQHYLSRSNTTTNLLQVNNINSKKNNHTDKTKENHPLKSNSLTLNSKRNIVNPSDGLLFKTVQVINNYVDHFEKSRPLLVSSQTNNKIKNRVGFSNSTMTSGFNRLRPLNYVLPSGPLINSCMGIIKEPEDQNKAKLREIYQYKLQLLKNKNLSLQSSATTSQVNFNNTTNSTNNETIKTFRSITTPN